MSLDFPGYDELAQTLNHIQSNSQAAEIHGMLCGHICATMSKKMQCWDNLFTHTQKDKIVYPFLNRLYKMIYAELNEFSFNFNLLLPDEDTDINIRAEALGLWCQGFLTALKQCNFPLQNHPQPSVNEALHDFTEIANIHSGDIPKTEQDEEAYVELMEYVRLSVVMIFHELIPPDLKKRPPTNRRRSKTHD